MPRPLQVDLWPFDVESGVRVTCDVGYLCAKFSLPRPLCSRLRPDVHDRQTDVRRASSLDAPYPRGGGITSRQERYDDDCLQPLTLTVALLGSCMWWFFLNSLLKSCYWRCVVAAASVRRTISGWSVTRFLWLVAMAATSTRYPGSRYMYNNSLYTSASNHIHSFSRYVCFRNSTIAHILTSCITT